jgi:putative cardiolipin synthase
MHNKLMIADNSIALVGGRNIGDAYFQIDPEGQLGDYETFAGGPIVHALSDSFDAFWASELAIPVAALAKPVPTKDDLAKYRAELREHRQEKREDGSDYASRVATGEPLRGMLAWAYQPVAAPGATPAVAAAATADTGPITRRASMLVWAPAQVKFDPPNKRKVEKEQASGPKIRDVVDEAADGLRREFLMISAYLIPGADGMRLFDKLNQRNITARVITNSMESNTEPSAHSGYLHYRTDILRDNVELHEVRAHLGSARGSGQNATMNQNGTFGIHTKLYVFDREKLFVSSMNFDARSRHINTELGLMIESPDLARQAAALFDGLAQPANSYRVTLEPRGHLETPQVVWRTLENGRIVELYKDPAKDEWQRLQVEMMSLLPFDHEL